MSNLTKKLLWTADDDGRVTVPEDLADREIRAIHMAHAKCTISLHVHQHIDESEKSSHYSIELKNPQYLSFISDHLQNVVDSAHIFRREQGDKAKNFKDFSVKKQFPTDCKIEAEYYLFISPIIGGDLFIAADSIQFFSCPSVSAD